MSHQLDYISSPPPPLHLDRLALGALILALGPVLEWICSSTCRAGIYASPFNLVIYTAGPLLNAFSVLAAVPLLAAAPRTPSNPIAYRKKTRLCLILAALFFVSDSAHLSLIFKNFDDYTTFALAFLAYALAPFLKLILILWADTYLLSVGKTLDRPAWGAAAATALSLTGILTLLSLLEWSSRVLGLDFFQPAPFFRFYNPASIATAILFSLLWTTIALVAVALRRTPRPHPAFTQRPSPQQPEGLQHR